MTLFLLVMLVVNGWKNAQRRPLTKFMTICEEGPIFLKAIDGWKEYNDKYYMNSIIKDVIKEVRPQNMVQIIMDNVVVCKTFGLLIEVEFPCHFWTPCVVDTLNLRVKNMYNK